MIAWPPRWTLPTQLIHGDIHFDNVVQIATGEPAYLDFGSIAQAPRLHDLAYTLAHMALTLAAHHAHTASLWPEVPRLVHTYEEATGFRLTELEQQALALLHRCGASPIHRPSGILRRPSSNLHGGRRYLDLSSQLLAEPPNVSFVRRGLSVR